MGQVSQFRCRPPLLARHIVAPSEQPLRHISWLPLQCRRMPPILRNGSTAVANAMIPRPPRHCIIDLSSNMSFGMESSPDNTVAPVVAIAEILSKTAPVKLCTGWDKLKGNAPNAHTSRNLMDENEINSVPGELVGHQFRENRFLRTGRGACMNRAL